MPGPQDQLFCSTDLLLLHCSTCCGRAWSNTLDRTMGTECVFVYRKPSVQPKRKKIFTGIHYHRHLCQEQEHTECFFSLCRRLGGLFHQIQWIKGLKAKTSQEHTCAYKVLYRPENSIIQSR